MNEPTIPASTPPAPAEGSETWPNVLEFARAMECKLAQNRHKGDRAGWMACDPDWLLARLVDEVLELSSAIRSGDLQSVLGEAADVANFAMMIADRVEALPTTERSGGGKAETVRRLLVIAEKAMESIREHPCGHKPNGVGGKCQACEALAEWDAVSSNPNHSGGA